MIEICAHNECAGCGACVNACPAKCIVMCEDAYGELHPAIDYSVCLNCGKCKLVCPNNQELMFRRPHQCFASWITDRPKRSICASGGMATAFSEYVIRFKKGIVFGTAYDANMIPLTTWTENVAGLESFKGSKYVQSTVGADTFRRIEEFLRQGRFVVYIATPCQIAGALSYLGRRYDNLFTVDLICHGVCPTRYFMDTVASVKEGFDKCGSDLRNVRFRGNDGNNYRMTFWDWQNRQMKSKRWKSAHYYMAGFLKGVTLRENCYSCIYARPERIADVTLGDFIGLGAKKPFPYDMTNVSSVFTNTENGIRLYRELQENMPEIVSVERDLSERLDYRLSLVEPFPRHPLNALFRECYRSHGFLHAARRTLAMPLLRERLRQVLARWIAFPRRSLRKLHRIMVRRGGLHDR